MEGVAQRLSFYSILTKLGRGSYYRNTNPSSRPQFLSISGHSRRNMKGNRMSYKVSVIIEKDEHGYYAYCPELEGCQTQGDSLEEVLANMKEAVELYLETLSADEIEEALSKEILTTTLEVQVA